jgi:YfiH family protein
MNCDYRFFDRHGGVSTGAYESLNLGMSVGDSALHVQENRRRVKESMGISRLVSATQVHGDDICFVDDGAVAGDGSVGRYDALITTEVDTGLLIQQADCQAVLLYDKAAPAIAAIHCGWRGSVAGIIGRTVAAMTNYTKSSPESLRAFISPSLGPCCAEFVNYADELPASFLPFQTSANHFDFWRISTMQLIEAGLTAGAVHLAGKCTCCNTDYFSYRRMRRRGLAATGRQGSVIALVDTVR